MVHLQNYRVSLREDPDEDFIIAFDCMADDHTHAFEQAQDAYPRGAMTRSVCYGNTPPNEWAYSLSPGMTVWWNDPDGDISSGEYVIHRVESESGKVDHLDTILLIKNEAGSQAEVLPHELTPRKPLEPIVDDQKKFDVHLFYPVKFKVSGISLPVGSSHADAMKAAVAAVETEVLLGSLGSGVSIAGTPLPSGGELESVEYTDDAVLFALVDPLLENGEVDYNRTLWLDENGLPDLVGEALEKEENRIANWFRSQIEDGHIDAESMARRMARYGLMDPGAFRVEMNERMTEFVIHSPKEAENNDGAGFWSNDDGWTTLEGATRFPFVELGLIDLNLPSIGTDDAKTVSVAEAETIAGRLENPKPKTPRG